MTKFEFLDSVYSKLLSVASKEVALFVACQFALESAFGSSYKAIIQKNFCGMKSPQVRMTFGDTSSRFASFSCLDDCISDYLLWLAWNRFTQSNMHNLFEFKYKLVKKGYCSHNEYISRIENLYEQFKPNFI